MFTNKKENIFNKNIEIKNETQIKCVVIMWLYYYVSLYLFDIADRIYSLWATRWFISALYIIITIPVVLVYKKWGGHREPKINLKDYRQYIYGILTLIPYYIVKVIVLGPDTELGLTITEISFGELAWSFLYYAVIVACCEEFVFRMFFQGELVKILGKLSWLAPFIAAVLFALAHIPQGYIEQVYIAFGAGLVIGYARYFIPGYSFISLVMAHGLYDFLVIMLL